MTRPAGAPSNSPPVVASPAVAPSSAAPGPTNAEVVQRVQGVQDRISKLEGRLDQMTLQQQHMLPAWITPTVGVLGLLATVTGVLVTHRLSQRRQRQDEFFKRLQECQALVDKVSLSASNAWRQTGKKAVESGLVRTLLGEIDDLTDRVSALGALNTRFLVNEPLAEFRQIALLDVEDPSRRADANRGAQVLGSGRLLARRMLEAYRVTFH